MSKCLKICYEKFVGHILSMLILWNLSVHLPVTRSSVSINVFTPVVGGCCYFLITIECFDCYHILIHCQGRVLTVFNE